MGKAVKLSVKVQSAGLERKLANIAKLWKTNAGRRCVNEIERIIRDDNREYALKGIDRYGREYTPLRSPRRGEYANGEGPPLDPFENQSRIVTKFRCKIRDTIDGYTLGIGWESFPILDYHRTGAGRLPRRDPAGIRPGTHAKIRAAIRRMLPQVSQG